MINIRHELYETNSSSVHSLVLKSNDYEKKKKITIFPVKAESGNRFATLAEKVSYIASFILYHNGSLDGLEDLWYWTNFIKEVEEITGCEVVIPKNFKYDEIEINHQLVEYSSYPDSLIESLGGSLATILDDKTTIVVESD